MNRVPELVTGTFTRKVNGVEFEASYAYMASPATIWDAELIAWANEREARLKRLRNSQRGDAARKEQDDARTRGSTDPEQGELSGGNGRGDSGSAESEVRAAPRRVYWPFQSLALAPPMDHSQRQSIVITQEMIDSGVRALSSLDEDIAVRPAAILEEIVSEVFVAMALLQEKSSAT